METPDGGGPVAFLSDCTDRERGTMVHLLPVRGTFSSDYACFIGLCNHTANSI